MGRPTILAEHEDLRRALRWLGEHPPVTAAKIEAASRRFDLSPRDEEFLLREFTERGPAASDRDD